MARALLVLAAFTPFAAFAQTPGVVTRAPVRHVVDLALAAAPAEGVCTAVAAPLQWPDASDAWTFAEHPTARLDDQELAAAQLRGLVQLRLFGRALHFV